MSLRVRLGIALAVLLTLGFGVFGVAEHATLRSVLSAKIDETLSARGHALVRATEAMVATSAAGRPPAHIVQDLLEGDASPEVFAQVRAADGRLIAATDNVASLDLSRFVGSGEGAFTTATLAPDLRVRLLALPVHKEGHVIGTVIVGESLRLLESSLRQSVAAVVATGLVLLSAVLVLVGFVLRHGLEPLRQVAGTAQQIVQSGDFSRRVPQTRGGDEVAEVGDAFNALVGQVNALLDAQSRLLADTSHELRNPLTVVKTNLDMMALDIDDDTRIDALADAQWEAERMAALVNDLLTLSAAETAPTPQLALIDLTALVTRIVDGAKSLAPEHAIMADAPVPVMIRGDAERLSQIVRNLLDNAIRYTPPGGTVTVRVVEAGDHVDLVVTDSGIGIPPEHQPFVFERFYRVDPARSRESGGTGLGLSIVRALSRLHGGDVSLRSEPGHGCTFTVSLPREGRPDMRRNA